jgi:hypothetical protein
MPATNCRRDRSPLKANLVKRYDDLALPGRGPPLAFTRTYTNRSDEASPLGSGWDHNYRSFVTPVPLFGFSAGDRVARRKQAIGRRSGESRMR